MNKLTRPLRTIFTFTALLLLIEFFDELHYALGGAALPAIQDDLHLSYAQVGLLLGLPHIIGVAIEWLIMLLGDTHLRKALVIGGGLAVVLAIALIASAPSFMVILGATILAFPASGAFVTLAQATLVDQNPQREAQVMARWTLAGSIGNLVGPILLAGVFAAGLTWRWGYWALAAVALPLVLLVLRSPFPKPAAVHANWRAELSALGRGAWQALTNLSLLRWMLLIEIADLLLDIFTSFAPLYFTNVAGMDNTQASLALSLMLAGSLIADAITIPLLERFQGRSLVRWSAVVALALFAAFLLAPWLLVKIALAMLVKIATLGWYAILKGETYAAVPGRSGTLNAINSLTGLVSGAIPWLVGLAAEQFGLPTAMWLLALGPICLILFTPRAAPGAPKGLLASDD